MSQNKRFLTCAFVSGTILGTIFGHSKELLAANDVSGDNYAVEIDYASDNTDCSVIIPAKIQIPKDYCGVGFDVGFHVTNLSLENHLTLKVCDGMSVNSELSLKRVGVETDSTLQEVYALLLNTDGSTIIGNKTEIGTQAFSGEEIINRIGPVYCMAFDKKNKLTDFENDTETTVKFRVSIDSN